MPRGYDLLLPHFRDDAQLRENFFSRLKFMFYAGAALSQPLWDAYRKLMMEACGERVLMATGLGATETAPMALQCTWDSEHSGRDRNSHARRGGQSRAHGDKVEIRVKGPNVTPGYWRDPELTSNAFDDEGYYKFGDAVRFVDPDDVNKGLFFDGRFAEDFKLASGTFVNVGPLRSSIIHWFVAVRDRRRDHRVTTAIIWGCLIVPNLEACRTLASAICPPGLRRAEVLRHEAVRREIYGAARILCRAGHRQLQSRRAGNSAR